VHQIKKQLNRLHNYRKRSVILHTTEETQSCT